MKQKEDISSIKALTFDVFGTVVDWRTTIIRECTLLGKSKGISLSWGEFADAWRAGYAPAMNKVRTGELPWMNIDEIHRMILDGLLLVFNIKELSETEKDDLTGVWHRLKPWPDAIRGLKEGSIDFTIVQNPFMQGYKPVKLLFEYFFSGKKPESEYIYTESSIVLPESL